MTSLLSLFFLFLASTSADYRKQDSNPKLARKHDVLVPTVGSNCNKSRPVADLTRTFSSLVAMEMYDSDLFLSVAFHPR